MFLAEKHKILKIFLVEKHKILKMFSFLGMGMVVVDSFCIFADSIKLVKK